MVLGTLSAYILHLCVLQSNPLSSALLQILTSALWGLTAATKTAPTPLAPTTAAAILATTSSTTPAYAQVCKSIINYFLSSIHILHIVCLLVVYFKTLWCQK